LALVPSGAPSSRSCIHGSIVHSAQMLLWEDSLFVESPICTYNELYQDLLS
jgi:hypothetical protein